MARPAARKRLAPDVDDEASEPLVASTPQSIHLARCMTWWLSRNIDAPEPLPVDGTLADANIRKPGGFNEVVMHFIHYESSGRAPTPAFPRSPFTWQ